MKDEYGNRVIISADKKEMTEGMKAFNYYDMEVGCIGVIDNHAQPDTMAGQDSSTPMEEWDNYWFEFINAAGRHTSLDGSRICSIEFARRKGWM